MLVVVFNHLGEGGKAAIMIETAFAVREQSTQRRSAIALFAGTPLGLEIVHSDFFRRVQVPSGLSKQGRHMAGGAFCLGGEELLALTGRGMIKRGVRRLGRRQR